jgi:hypothetical protein
MTVTEDSAPWAPAEIPEAARDGAEADVAIGGRRVCLILATRHPTAPAPQTPGALSILDSPTRFRRFDSAGWAPVRFPAQPGECRCRLFYACRTNTSASSAPAFAPRLKYKADTPRRPGLPAVRHAACRDVRMARGRFDTDPMRETECVAGMFGERWSRLHRVEPGGRVGHRSERFSLTTSV